ncbi:MAG: late competence development ComFB family protein [Oligoflexia bacterium]|nr:late competence development ComFB family protein [Oligoflexia bacterium]
MDLINRDRVNYSVADCSLYDVINYNEFMILNVIREYYLKEPNLCKCSICIEDIYALSLNALPARYIQSACVDKYIRSISYIDEAEVKNKVINAIIKVRKSPNHK